MQKRALIGLGVLVHRHLSDSDNVKIQLNYRAVLGRMKPETVGLFITFNEPLAASAVPHTSPAPIPLLPSLPSLLPRGVRWESLW